MKTNRKSWIRIVTLLLVASLALSMSACRNQNQEDPTNSADPQAEKQTYTVKVLSAGGMALPNVGVYIYEDETKTELVWFDQTGEDGTMTFTDVIRSTYVAVLSDVPTGYAVEPIYPITGQTTTITLQAGQLDPDDVGDLTYKLGDMMMDFTVTGPDGTYYTLSELLKQKKAVMLNFWYIGCEPCKAEFPFLQQAYDLHSADMEVLAMNHIDSEADIAAFQKENSYTFPMLSCGAEWQKLMGLIAYPTTVIVDRFGNICLIHRGSIDDAKTFSDAFTYFTAEEYVPQLVQDIKDLEIESEEGSAENPIEVGGRVSFEIVVEPGKEVYTEIFKATGMYMSIKGQNKDFYVLYNDKTYTPDNSNTVGFVISTGDNYTPALFGVGNTGAETQTFRVNLSHLAGTFNNPHALNLGEFTATVNAGNSQGVYYRATAPEDGTYTVQCISAPAGVEYDFSLQSLDENRTILRSYRSEGSQDETTGYPTVQLPMQQGTGIMFAVGTLPDDSNSYPGGTFRFVVSFTPGEVEDIAKVEKIDYTITVTDEAGQPMQDITVWLTKDAETFSAKTDEQGLVTLNLEKGTYTGTVSVPEGYVLENNAFELTEEAPSTTVVLAAAVDTRVDYTITVTDPMGTPVEGAEVLILGAGSAMTDAAGTVVFKLEPGSYSVMTGTLPENFVCSDMLTLTEEILSAEFVLEYVPGTHQSNPVILTETDQTVANTGTIWYGTHANGATMEITGNAGFQVVLDGQPVSDTDGVVTWPIVSADPRSPVTFAIIGEGNYRVYFAYPAGHQMNPAAMVLGTNTAAQASDAADYYYSWTAAACGELTITMDAESQWLYSISNLTTGVAGDIHWSDDEVPAISQTVQVSEGDRIQVIVNTYDPADMFHNPAGDVTFQAAFVCVAEAQDFTTALIPAGSHYTYLLNQPDGGTLTIASAEAYVIYGNTAYGADSNGNVTVTLGGEESATLIIGNLGEADQHFEVSFTWPVGSVHNPDPKIKFRFPQNVTTALQADDADGYYYLITPAQTGTLTLTKASATAEYTIELIRNGQEIAIPAEGDATKAVSMYVIPGDEILLHVQAAAQEGTYPAATVVVRATFVVDYSTYTVTFDANGGALTGAESADTVNGKLPQMPTDPIRDGWEFLGWFDAAEGGNPIHESTLIRSNLVAYAQWSKIEFTVTFNPNGGTLDGNLTARTTDWKLTELPQPSLEGYTFEGWFDLPIGGNQITADMVYTVDTEIYAQWSGGSVTPDSGQLLPYEVTVVNGNGEPITSGVYVTWQGAGKVETKLINNASGTAAANLPAGTYSIILTLTGDYKHYHYDAATAVVTADRPVLTVQVAEPISDTATETEFGADSGVLITRDVAMGATYVTLNSSQVNYAVVNGKAYCFYRFLITEEGKYAFTTTNGAPISNWGTNIYFLEDRSTEEERQANAFTIEIKEGNFAEEVHELQLILAVEVTDSFTGTILQVKDAGDAEYTYLDAPFVVFEGTQTPEVAFENGKPIAIAENIFKLTTNGKKLTYVDMLNDKAVKGKDGFYHLNSEDGPILYVNLGVDAPYISMGTMVGAIGQYGTGFKKIFLNEDKTPVIKEDGTYHKEDYTDAMVAYALHADPTTGAYPLTDDLIYMIQHGGDFKGWYTPGSGTYLFEEKEIQVDPQLIWMFAVCYLK